MAEHSKADRAKIFAPFDALRGFRDALAEKERIIVPKIELSEEMKEELDIKFHSLHIRDMVTIIYFHQDEYLKITGMIAKFEPSSRILQVVNTRISLDDIRDIIIEKQAAE